MSNEETKPAPESAELLRQRSADAMLGLERLVVGRECNGFDRLPAERKAHAYAEQHGTLSLEQRVLIRLATTHAIQQAAQVGDAIHMAAGATAVFASSPFERWFRDLHAVTAHVQGHQIHYETTGQFFLGIQPEMAWL